MKLAPVTLAAALFLSSSSIAWALPPVDDATAARLAQDIDTYLTGLLGVYAQGTMRMEGKTAVQPHGDSYSFTLPTLVADTVPATFRSGAITGTLTPSDSNRYAFTLRLPNNIGTFTDIAGSAVATAALDTQDIKGVWQPDQELLPELTANISNFVLNLPKEKMTFGVRGLSLAVQNVVDSANRLSMSSMTTMKNVSLMGENSNLTVGSVALRSASSGLDYAAVKKAREELRSAFASPSPEKVVASKLPGMMEALASGAGTYSFSSEISNLLMNYDTHITGKAGSWTVAKATLSSEGASTEGGLSTISFAFGHEGLTMDPVPSPALGAVLPTQSAFRVDMNKIPVADLIKGVMDQAATSSDPSQILKQILGKAGSEIRIIQAGTKSPSLAATLAGAFVADAQSRFGFSGTLDGKLSGVDELVTKIGQMTAASSSAANGGAPSPQADPSTQGLLMALSIIQTQGTPVPNSTPSVRRYLFELGKNGSFKLNGVDLGMMLGINTAAQPTPPAVETNLPPASPLPAPPAMTPDSPPLSSLSVPAAPEALSATPPPAAPAAPGGPTSTAAPTAAPSSSPPPPMPPTTTAPLQVSPATPQ